MREVLRILLLVGAIFMVAGCGDESAPPAAGAPDREPSSTAGQAGSPSAPAEARDIPMFAGEPAPNALDLPEGTVVLVFYRGHG